MRSEYCEGCGKRLALARPEGRIFCDSCLPEDFSDEYWRGEEDVFKYEIGTCYQCGDEEVELLDRINCRFCYNSSERENEEAEGRRIFS